VQDQEFIRPGFELGFKEGDKYFIYNHLTFNILVHPTHGEYMRARQQYKNAALLDNMDAKRKHRLLLSEQELLRDGASRTVLESTPAAAAADGKGMWAWLGSMVLTRVRQSWLRVHS
jgi:transmembrane 9 superfamily protein 2/4